MILNKMAEKAAEKLAQELVEKLVIPKIEGFTNWCRGKYNEYFIPTAEHFQEYIKRSYKKYSIINTLVFHNSQRKLKDIYVAQTLVKEHRSDGKEETTKIDEIPVELINKYKKILITDTAGMGKSTMMKRMFIDLTDRGMRSLGIPIYIELNRLKKGHSILMEIHEELRSLSKEFDKDLYLKLIQTGGFIFFLDGYDEISIADRNEVTDDIQDFISKAGTNNYYIMTSRPESGLLSSFGDFQSFNIQPLTKDEAYELLKKYDLSKNKELSEKLVELLKSGHYNSIGEFLENPLLVSLLFTAYDFNRSIPFEKHRFYRVVFEAYFEKHDNTKPLKSRDKLSKLNYDGFDRILRYVGYDCLIKTGVKFNKDTILNSIRNAKKFCGYTGDKDFFENDFLKDLTSSVPLFCKDGNEYKWVHKSLLEYFAARFIFCDAKENQNKILSAIYNSKNIEKYLNMLDLYYDLDPKGFSINITLPFCESVIRFHDDNMINSDIRKELIDERLSCLLITKMALVVSSDDELTESDVDELLHRTHPDLFVLNDYRIHSIKHEKVYLIFGSPSLFFKLRILEGRIPSIYAYYNSIMEMRRGAPKEISQLEHNKVHVVDVKTGDQSNELYGSINTVINFFGKLLSYEGCKKEVERIKNEIAESDDPIVLLDNMII